MPNAHIKFPDDVMMTVVNLISTWGHPVFQVSSRPPIHPQQTKTVWWLSLQLCSRIVQPSSLLSLWCPVGWRLSNPASTVSQQVFQPPIFFLAAVLQLSLKRCSSFPHVYWTCLQWACSQVWAPGITDKGLFSTEFLTLSVVLGAYS